MPKFLNWLRIIEGGVLEVFEAFEDLVEDDDEVVDVEGGWETADD